MKVQELLEARSKKHTYHLEEVRGELDKVILKLEGTESARFTRLGNRYKRIKKHADALKKYQDTLNAEAKKELLALFDAEDEVLTRIVETVSISLQLAKTPKPKPSVDHEKVLEALTTVLTPELIAKMEELKKQFTTIPRPKSPSLTIKINEGKVSDLWKAVKEVARRLLSSFKAWGREYDKKLGALKKLVAVNEAVHRVAPHTFTQRPQVDNTVLGIAQRRDNSKLYPTGTKFIKTDKGVETKMSFHTTGDSMIDDGVIWVLVCSDESVDWEHQKWIKYHGINVGFDLKTQKFVGFMPGDKIAAEEAKKYKDEIIKVARKEAFLDVNDIHPDLAESELMEGVQIPERIKAYMFRNDMKYKAETLEELRKEHARALLRGGRPTGEEEGLSYALNMNGLSKAQLEIVASGYSTPEKLKAVTA